ncbi:U-Kazal-Dg21.2-like [Vanessa atalanta]|uniref:U-Kazal-Dg21.2-like n=1 Tax=Vanessa atalanta TaxID=42275 RepID=UPI001FCD0FA5|nr:U-Kazal-Dg21.2-like [Vanessa atalanta]
MDLRENGVLNIEDIVVWMKLSEIAKSLSQECQIDCPVENENMVCAFEIKKSAYKMFPSKCAMEGFAKCYDMDFVRTPLRYCIKEHFASTRRMYGESCPVFCPSHYRPVCGASKYRDYLYRTFTNGCYLDMINCRGDDDFTGYVEVPLQFCQRHLMKNIFKEKLIMSNAYDHRDY